MGEEMWNPNYRDSKVNVVPTGTAPCKVNCPAHIAVQGYIKLAAQGKYREALELIRKENPCPQSADASATAAASSSAPGAT
jgi:hypothetical protein